MKAKNVFLFICSFLLAGSAAFAQQTPMKVINKTEYPIIVTVGARNGCPPAIGANSGSVTVPPFSAVNVPPVFPPPTVAFWNTTIGQINVPNSGTTVTGSSNLTTGCSIFPGFPSPNGYWTFGPDPLTISWFFSGGGMFPQVVYEL